MSNPFEHNRASASEKTFTGRQDELQFIRRSFVQTLDGHPSHVMVYGDRGLGKTSLLNHLKEEYKEPENPVRPVQPGVSAEIWIS